MADYGGFGSIVREAQAIDLDEKSRPEVDCPLCGLVLVANTRAELACPMGHYRTRVGATK